MKLALLALAVSPALAAAQELHCSQGELAASSPLFGAFPREVSVGDGFVFVSDGSSQTYRGSVRVFEPGPNGTWVERQLLTGANHAKAFGAAISIDGDRAVISDPVWRNGVDRRGLVHVFERDAAGTWNEVQVFDGPEPGPYSIGNALSLDGDWLAVYGDDFDGVWDGEVFVYRRNAVSGLFEHVQTLETPANGNSMGWPVSIDGDLMLCSDSVGAGGAGQAFVFRRDAAGVWNQEALISAPVPASPGYFGGGVASGGELFLEAYATQSGNQVGEAYRFKRNPNTLVWELAQTFTPNDLPPNYGPAVGMSMRADGDVLAISTHRLHGVFILQGRVIVYRRDAAGDFQPEHALFTGQHGSNVETFGEVLDVSSGLVVAGSSFMTEPDGSNGLWAYDFSLEDCDGNGQADACEFQELAADLNGDRVLDACEQAGSAYCGPAVPNSTGVAARLQGLGAPVAGGSLDLCATSMPSGAFGYLLGSAVQGFVVMPGGSSGNLCLGGGPTFGRFTDQVQAATGAGLACVLVDLSAIPTAGPAVTLLAGDTWNFQYWYRDGQTSNHTAGVEVVVQ